VCLLLTAAGCLILLFTVTGPVVGEVLDDVIPILRANLQRDKDAELRSKFLTLLSRLIVDADTTLNSNQRSPLVAFIYEVIILI